MANGVLGLGSGQAASLNSDLIEKLKTAERKSTVAPIETNITKMTKEKETFSSISKKVSELLEAIKPFDLFVSGGVTAFEQKSASTSGDSVTFDAADIKTLNAGTTTVNVSQLAQKDVYQSGAFNSTTKDAKINQGILTINEKDFNTTNLTYKQLADKISAEKGMVATVEEVGTNSYRLVIKSEESGVENKLNISGYAGSVLGFDTKDIYQSNTFNETAKNDIVGEGILTINGNDFDTDNLTYDELVTAINAKSGLDAKIQEVGTDSFRLLINSETSGTTLTIGGAASSSSTLELNKTSNHLYKTGSHVLEAQNMMAEVDGVKYDVSSNNVTVDGLKITANKTGISSINISQDNTQIETQMKNFVTKYNELVASIESEAQSSDSSLGDKSTIRSIINQIKDKLFGTYGEDNKKSIFNFGIELDKYGSLSLNSTKFNKAVSEDLSSLKDLFLGTAENKGLGTVLKENLDNMTFTGGVLDTYQKAMLTRETRLTDEKTKAEKALDTKYEQLALQFSTYGTIINQMESAFSGLKMMISQSTSGN